MPDRKTLKLLDGLQEDLGRGLAAMAHYLYQSSMVFGPQSITLAPLLRRQAQRELEHAAVLCDQISGLGGVPQIGSKSTESRDLKQMLQADLDGQRAAILDLRERAKQADLAGELGLKVALERLVADKGAHVRLLEQVLRGWP